MYFLAVSPNHLAQVVRSVAEFGKQVQLFGLRFSNVYRSTSFALSAVLNFSRLRLQVTSANLVLIIPHPLGEALSNGAV